MLMSLLVSVEQSWRDSDMTVVAGPV